MTQTSKCFFNNRKSRFSVIGPRFALLLCLCALPSTDGFAKQSSAKSFNHLTSTQYQRTVTQQFKNDFRPTNAKVSAKESVAYFDVEFEKAKPHTGFLARHDIDDARFREIAIESKRNGYSLLVHEVYRVDGKNLNLAFWERPLGKDLGIVWRENDDVPAAGETNRHFQALDDLFADYLKKHQLPGATVAVSYRGKVIYERGFGYADFDTKETMKQDSMMRIASVSKPITGAAIMQLVDRGRIKLDTTVFDLLDFEPMDPKTMDPQLKKITIRQLLNHTAGFDRQKSYDPMFKPYVMAKALGKQLPIDTGDIIRFMMSQPLDFDPGERMAYSNYGYCLLGRVIEKISGQTYEEYVKEHILKPVKVSRMQIGNSLESDRVEGEVKYFLRRQTFAPAVVAPAVGNRVKHQYGKVHVPNMDAHGAWIASAADLARFAMAFDDPKKCSLMGGDAVEEMFAMPDYLDIKPNDRGNWRYYAAGWSVVRWKAGFNAYHSGALAGTSTMLVRRKDGFNWAILFNCRKTPDGKEAVGEIDGLMHRAVDAAAKSHGWSGD